MNRVALSNPLKTDPELGMSSYLRFMAGIVITAIKDLKKKKGRIPPPVDGGVVN